MGNVKSRTVAEDVSQTGSNEHQNMDNQITIEIPPESHRVADEVSHPNPHHQLLHARVTGLYQDAITMSRRSKVKAALLKMTSILFALMVIVLGMAIAMVSVFDFEEKRYFMVIAGCLVSGIKSVVMIFNPEYRASILKQIHVRSRKLSRAVMDLIQRRSSAEEIRSALLQLQREYDELDLASFMATIAEAQTYAELRTVNERTTIPVNGMGPMDQLAGTLACHTAFTNIRRPLPTPPHQNMSAIQPVIQEQPVIQNPTISHVDGQVNGQIDGQVNGQVVSQETIQLTIHPPTSPQPSAPPMNSSRQINRGRRRAIPPTQNSHLS